MAAASNPKVYWVMTAALRFAAALLLVLVSGVAPGIARAQLQEDAMLLVAHPAFRDLEYRQTVLLAAPAPNGGHVGGILTRPPKRSRVCRFPEDKPSGKVLEPVCYGGPFS